MNTWLLLITCLFAGVALSSLSRANALTADEQTNNFFARGVAAERRGEMDVAERCYALTVRANPSHAEALDRLKDLQETRESFLSGIFRHPSLNAIHHGKEPTSSRDTSITPFIWKKEKGAFESVQYDFSEPKVVDGCGVFWLQDGGTVKLPAFWKVLFLDDAGFWMPVDATPAPPLADGWNDVRFTPLLTKGLRLLVQLDWESTAGFLEWKISTSSVAPVAPHFPGELWLDEQLPISTKVPSSPTGNVLVYRVNRYHNDMEAKGTQILLNGQPCSRYLFAHAESEVKFHVPPGYTRFSAVAMGPQWVGKGGNYSWYHAVLANDQPLFEGPSLTVSTGKRYSVDVELPPGTETITLLTKTKNGIAYDHSIWAHPRLIAGSATQPCSPETEARLAQLADDFQAAGAGAAEAVYQDAMQDLKTKYLAAINQALSEARQAGQAIVATTLQEEGSKISSGTEMPAEDDPQVPDSLKKLRGIYRAEAAKAAQAHAASLKPLLDRYDAELAALEATLAALPGDLATVQAVRQRIAGRSGNP